MNFWVGVLDTETLILYQTTKLFERHLSQQHILFYITYNGSTSLPPSLPPPPVLLDGFVLQLTCITLHEKGGKKGVCTVTV